jgi:hypothetical protein
MLRPTAKKEEQVNLINRHDEILAFLVEYAFGDEEALTRLQAYMSKSLSTATPTAEAPPTAGVAAAFAIDKAPAAVIPFPSPAADKCACPMAVKVKDSATHLCQLCGLNAYENKYVFAHTDEGKTLLDQTQDNAKLIAAAAADIEMHGAFISADGIEFQPTSEMELEYADCD